MYKPQYMKYYKHNTATDVICERIGNQLRFGKWKWVNKFCSEDYTYKNVTPEFFDSFTEITHELFNIIWGRKLQQA